MTPLSPHDELQWATHVLASICALCDCQQSARSSSPNFHLWPPRKYDTTRGRVHNDDASPMNAPSVVAHWTPTLFVALGQPRGLARSISEISRQLAFLIEMSFADLLCVCV